GREVLEHHAALARGVEVRLPRDCHHVRVGQHGEEPRLAAHVLPCHRRGASQLGEQLVRGPGDEGVRIGEHGGRGGHGDTVSPPGRPFSRPGRGAMMATMVDEDDVRRVALSLPETTEKPSYGTPGFRVKDRLFARIREEGDILVVWTDGLEEKEAL